MTSIETLRAKTEEDAALAVSDVGEAFPIADAATLAIVIGRLYAGPATQIEIGSALEGAYVSLPLKSPAELLEAFNRFLDLKLGEAED